MVVRDRDYLSLHKKAIVVDGLNFSKIDRAYIEKMLDGGVTAVNSTVAPLAEFPFGFRETIREIANKYAVIDENRDISLLAKSVRDIEQAKESGKVAIIFGFQNMKAIEDDLRMLTIFHKLGVRIMQLTYQERNLIGDGCTERTDCGLSDFGIAVVEEMNRLGIVIDLSHVGRRSTLDAVEFSKQPVIFSHANPHALCDHLRNKTDEEVKALAEKGGVVGVNALPAFLAKKPKATVEDLLDAIDYYVQLVGFRFVGIGLDLVEGRTEEDMKPYLKTFKRGVPPSGWMAYPEGIDSATKIPNITKGLVERGYSNKEIMGILGGNFIRVFKEVWGA